MQEERVIGEWEPTNEVGRNFAIAKSSRWNSANEVPPIGRKIALSKGTKIVVIARVHYRISENKQSWNCFIIW